MLAQSDRFTVTELCEQYGISRKTGYKHLERYAANGLKGLAERSHRPHHFAQLTDEVVEALIVEERRLPAATPKGRQMASRTHRQTCPRAQSRHNRKYAHDR
jgi:transposase